MAHYIFNISAASARQTIEALRSGMWGVEVAEPHRDALAPGDLALVYVAAPERVFVGRAALVSGVHGSRPAVALAEVEEWDPPVPMSSVLARIDRSAGARADFEVGVVGITASEYEKALEVAAELGARRR